MSTTTSISSSPLHTLPLLLLLLLLLSPLTSAIPAAAAAASSDEIFESHDFNIAQALREHGILDSHVAYLSELNDHGRCSCVDACATLLTHYNTTSILLPNTTAYSTFRSAYWSSLQTAVYPTCVFTPPDADAVAVAVLLARMTACPFAVKSGGHSAFAGAASIEAGITVSLQNLHEIELSSDKKVAGVGPGNTWRDVYEKLAENEVTAVGGRVARIGVGGLTLGGGISFFSGFHGWACDNVDSYEVVTASGSMVNASPTQNQDLYWALRGGGNNFGIVIKFYLRTVPIPGNNVWGGSRVYTEPEYPTIIQAFTNLALNANTDPRAGQWTAFGKYNGTSFASSTLWYSNPSEVNTTTIFAEFNSIPSVVDSTRVRNLVEFVDEIQQSNPYGFREVYYTLSVKVSALLAQFAVDTFFSEVSAVAEVEGINPVLLFQSITVPQVVSMAVNGGNPLGLKPEDGPLFLISMPVWWVKESDDATVYTFTSNVLRKISDKAKELNLQSDYLYMNYASQFQDVIRGYGSENQARLIQTAQKYDPQGIFQTLQPGYFKLNRAPVPSDYFSGSWS